MRKTLLTTTSFSLLIMANYAFCADYIYIGQDGSYVNTNKSFDGKVITNQDENDSSLYNSIYNPSKGSIVNKLELNFKAILHENTAKNGGAIYQQSKTLTLNSASDLSSNYADNNGGAIYLLGLDSGLIANSTKFENNYAQNFGGAIFGNHQNSIISINGNSSFINNAAGTNGGAIYTYGTLNLNADSGDIIFKGNQANGHFNDISTGAYTLDEAIINILGSHKVEINGGINNIDKNKSSTINIGDGISGGNFNIKTADIYADKVNFNGNSNLYLTIKGSSLDPTLSYGRISANNINFYNGNNNIVINVDINTYNGADSQTIKVIDGAFNGNFDNLGTQDQYNNLTTSDKYTITSNGNDGEFIFQKTPNVSDGDNESENGETPSKNSGSNISNAWLESGTFQEGSSAYNVATHILNLSEKERNDALKALSPNNGQTVQAMTGQINSQVIGAVSSQLTGGAVSVSEGRAAGDGVFQKVRTWIKMLVNRAKLSGSDGFSSDAQGVSFGVDKLISENTRFGLGYAHTKGDIDSFMRSTDLQSHTAIVYAEYKPSSWYVNTVATYGWANYRENKNIAGINVKSKYDIDTISLQIMTGYEFGLLTPETGLRYTNYHHGSYKDSAEQFASSYNSDLLTAVAGLKIKKAFTNSNGTIFTPEAKIAATYDLTTSDDAALITIANGASYQTSSERLDRLGIEVGSGINIDINNEIETSLGYEGRFRKDYQDHTGILKLKYKF